MTKNRLLQIAEFLGEDYVLLSLGYRDISVLPDDNEDPLGKSVILEVVQKEALAQATDNVVFGRGKGSVKKVV